MPNNSPTSVVGRAFLRGLRNHSILLFLTACCFSASAFAVDALESAESTKLRNDRQRELVQEVYKAATDAPLLPRLVAVARQLLQEFPTHPETGGSVLLRAADEMSGDESQALLTEVITGKYPDSLKERARGIQRRHHAQGRVLAMKFNALDGRLVDIAALRGKVVLIDFWATWCGPCVAQLPEILSTYNTMHDRGFEVIGISFDSDKTTLEQFIADRRLPWPQFFDSKGWNNQFGREYGIGGIPETWLIDKKGIFRAKAGRGHLTAEVQALLAESD